MSQALVATQARPMPQAAEARRWWVVAAAAVGLGLGFGAVSSLSVFMVPLGQEFGWPRASVASTCVVNVEDAAIALDASAPGKPGMQV